MGWRLKAHAHYHPEVAENSKGIAPLWSIHTVAFHHNCHSFFKDFINPPFGIISLQKVGSFHLCQFK